VIDVDSLDFSVLAPIGFVALGAMAALLLDVALSRRLPGATRPSVVLALTGTAALLLAIYSAAYMFGAGIAAPFNPAHPVLQLDALSSFSIALVGLAALLCLWASITYLPALHIDHGEYYALLLLSTAGMFVLVSAVDLLALFLGLELTSIPLYALAGFDRRKLRSNESALKYFLLGAFASAVLVYGMALLYGATGHTSFEGVREGFESGGSLALAGLALVIAGLAFKIAAVPFHQWAPDVYEGAPTSVTAFLSVTVKTAAFVALLRFLVHALPDMGDRIPLLMQGLAVLTMVVGNLMAVIQTSVKRLLAWSSIAHAGYLLVGLGAATSEAFGSVLFYLFVYVFMNLGAFCVVIALAQGGREYETIDDFAGLAARRPGLAAAMTLFLLSLAGIPGTAGFMAKFHLVVAAINADAIIPVLVLVATSLVSLFYYLRLPMVMYMREPRHAFAATLSSSELAVLCVCAAAVLYFAFFSQSDPFGLGFRALELAGRATAFPS
jgi:NADH-quinone oxidoreductase subunit N